MPAEYVIPLLMLAAGGIGWFIAREMAKNDRVADRQGKLTGDAREIFARLSALEGGARGWNEDSRSVLQLRDRLPPVPQLDILDITTRLARLEEFRDTTKEEIDEIKRALRIVTRLEEQFAAFKEVMERMEARWNPVLNLVARAMGDAVGPER